MITLSGDYFLYVDVDDTLVTSQQEQGVIGITHDSGGMRCTEYRTPHNRHILEMIEHKKNPKAVVVVWTQNTVEWAEAVVKRLGIEPYVDLVTSKPHRLLDDLSPIEFMPKSEWWEDK